MPHRGSAPPAFVSLRLRSRTLQGSASPTARDSFSEGNIPRFRARVTFGRSPKSDQKVCLKPQVSRLPARLTMSKNMAAYPAKAKIYADRRTTNRLYVSPRCRSRVPRGDALVYRLCGGVLACRSTKYASQQRVFFIFRGPTGRTYTCRRWRQVRDLIIA